VNRFRDLYRLYRDKGYSPEEVWRYIHRLYNKGVERVAQTETAELVDLQAELNDRRKLYDGPALWLFRDGIHFTELGMQEVARTLARHVLSGEERNMLEEYLGSSAYCRHNLEKFMTQWQFAAADWMLNRAEAIDGRPLDDLGELRARIAAERAFYDPYYAAQFELSNGGDENAAFTQLLACLQKRPTDLDLRLGLARYALLAQSPQLTLSLVDASHIEYTNRRDLYTAMWLVAHAAKALGQNDIAREQFRMIVKEFPQDSQAKAILADLEH